MQMHHIKRTGDHTTDIGLTRPGDIEVRTAKRDAPRATAPQCREGAKLSILTGGDDLDGVTLPLQRFAEAQNVRTYSPKAV